MRGTLTIAGVIGILVLAAPASAEDYYVGAPGVDVGIGSGYHHYRDRDRGDHYRTEGFDRSYGERGAVAGVVGIEVGVVSGVFNLESSGVRAPDWRPRHDKHYHDA